MIVARTPALAMNSAGGRQDGHSGGGPGGLPPAPALFSIVMDSQTTRGAPADTSWVAVESHLTAQQQPGYSSPYAHVFSIGHLLPYFYSDPYVLGSVPPGPAPAGRPAWSASAAAAAAGVAMAAPASGAAVAPSSGLTMPPPPLLGAPWHPPSTAPPARRTEPARSAPHAASPAAARSTLGRDTGILPVAAPTASAGAPAASTPRPQRDNANSFQSHMDDAASRLPPKDRPSRRRALIAAAYPRRPPPAPVDAAAAVPAAAVARNRASDRRR